MPAEDQPKRSRNVAHKVSRAAAHAPACVLSPALREQVVEKMLSCKPEAMELYKKILSSTGARRAAGVRVRMQRMAHCAPGCARLHRPPLPCATELARWAGRDPRTGSGWGGGPTVGHAADGRTGTRQMAIRIGSERMEDIVSCILNNPNGQMYPDDLRRLLETAIRHVRRRHRAAAATRASAASTPATPAPAQFRVSVVGQLHAYMSSTGMTKVAACAAASALPASARATDGTRRCRRAKGQRVAPAGRGHACRCCTYDTLRCCWPRLCHGRRWRAGRCGRLG